MRSPSACQVSSLSQALQHEHGEIYDSLGALATKLAGCIRTKSQARELVLEERPDVEPHAGRVVVDAMLSVGHKYNRQVAPAVTRVLAYHEAETISGFSSLIRERGSKQVIGWKEGPI